MNGRILVFLGLCLLPTVYSEGSAAAWCYHQESCNESKWASIAPEYCNGTRQSPINIVTTSVKPDGNLTAFSYTGFNSNSTLTRLTNTGHTVKVDLDDAKMNVSGGNLPATYRSIQFHFHWGNGSSSGGSDHTVDGKQYPLELHIVNLKSNYTGINDAFNDSTGLAVLGFFIEATNETGKPDSWKILTDYLPNITKQGDNLDILDSGITMDSLLEGVNRTKYYRYLGSLTSPNCNEVVVWTVFKDPIKVSKDLIDLFSKTVQVNSTPSTAVFATNTYRSVQQLNSRVVTSQPSSASILHSTLSLLTALLCSVLWCWV
ncbi:carbonic anhydrase 4-like [Trichomycterus rosablanca]|uniref:carbonic anhydrase 4-like n=1 Tax=Trichomycterus rosablanca TaxID=2290929 RepID=UPI002F35411F